MHGVNPTNASIRSGVASASPAFLQASSGLAGRFLRGRPAGGLAAGLVMLVATASAQVTGSIAELSLSEGAGTATTNSGSLGGAAPFAQQTAYPIFSANVPAGLFAPTGNQSSVDFGDIAAGQGGRAIDLTTATGLGGTLGAMNAFTVCGWVNARNLNEGGGGNRVAFALAAQNGPGFDIVQLATGALRIGINQWPDGSGGGGPFSTTGKITADPAAGPNNWVFFAVTYDSSAGGGQVKYYFGKPSQAASLDVTGTYARGAVASSGRLTLGNFSSVDTGARNATGPGNSRVFRGLMDEVRVYDRALGLAEIQSAQIAPAFKPIDPPPVVADIIPQPNANVRNFRQVEVLFNEAVQGVDATDLLINGSPATNLVMVAPDEYVFHFPQPATGAVAMAWATGHGIRDFAQTPNEFVGNGWTNLFDPNAALARPLITEFMADNKKTLNDEDGVSSDWIEVFNPDVEPVNLEGCFLTDATNALTKWRFPAVVLAPNSYLVVFASEKNRTNPAAPLHTNFKLEKSGEYLALVDSATNVLSEFAPIFPAQQQDVSYGRDRLTPGLTGYFATPTPGAANSTSGAGFAPEVVFSRASGSFTGPFWLALSAPDTNAVIRYLLVNDAASAANTNVPGPTSPVYTNALFITNTVQIRARTFAAGLFPGTPGSETYLAMDTNVVARSSDLPVAVVHTLGGGDFNQSALKTAHLSIYEPVLGRTSLSNAPTVTTRAALRVRGNTSAGSAKKSWTMETWDEFNDDKDVALLDMPAESDWVLYGPASMEPVMIHNPFAYELARRLGHWAPRTRFVELYLNTAGGTITTNNYHGIYVLVEKVKVADGRIDEPRMEPEITNGPALSGTYLMQVDRLESGESGVQIPPVLPNTLSSGGNAITFTDPKESEILLPQRAAQRFYIRNHLTNFVSTLNSPGYADPVTGYPAYVNVAPSINNHMVVTLCFSVDAFNFSSYFYKARNGKLTFGPIWDFDRSLESKDDPRDDNPRIFRYVGSWEAFDFFNWSWWGRMFQDTNFWQLWVDRYQQMRQTELSHASLNALIDNLTAQLRESQVRDVARWPGVTTPRTSFDWEVTHMKEWLTNRLNFFDTNFLAMPLLNTQGGRVAEGFVLQMAGPSAPAGTQTYYTLNGMDPRLPGGAISPSAFLYTGPVTITNNARVIARSRNLNHKNLTGGPSNGNPPATTPWSGPAEAVLVIRDVPLVITEIMYHPAGAPSGNTNDADNFEFIELKNVGLVPLSLLGVRFTNGIDYTFTTNSAVTQLAAGGTVILVKNLTAFQSRYPGVTNVAGEFSGTLENTGERLALIGGLAEPILDFSFSDEWHPITDGAGFSMVIADERAAPGRWGDASSWRVGSRFGGSPGAEEATPTQFAPVVVNEVLTHTDPLPADAIELFNPSTNAAAIGDWWLTDDFGTPQKYRIPAGTTIPAGGFVVFYQSNSFGLGANAFGLSSQGDEIYLFSGNAADELTGYLHGFDFGAQLPGATFGRHVISTGEDHFPSQLAPTLGAANAGPLVGPIVISEIHYHPPDIAYPGGFTDNTGDEYIELHNISGAPMPLFDLVHSTNTWRLRDAVDFAFPEGTTMPAGSYALVVSFNPTNAAISNVFAAQFALPVGVPVFGPFSGKLDNSGDSVELVRPSAPLLAPAPDAGLVSYVLADKAKYSQDSPWPAAADGLGASLQRLVEAAYGNDPANWQAASTSAGASYNPAPLPVISSQPLSQTNVAYHNVVLGITASSPTPMRYQWRFNGSHLPGATNAILELSNVQPAQAGMYSVVAWNAAGSVTSEAASLTLLIPASILSQPLTVSVRIPPDAQAAPSPNVTFTAMASSSGIVRHQWRFNGNPIDRATNSSLTISNVQAGDWGEYTVAITDSISTVLSAPAWLYPLIRPGFAIGPLSQTVAINGSVSVSLIATGWPPPFSFEWRRLSPSALLATNSQMDPQSFCSFTATNVPAAVNYRAVVRNAALPAGVALNFTVTTLADDDGDGIPDVWWSGYGLNAANDRLADSDGDGLLNGQEYFAGTDPTNALSVLRVETRRIGNGCLVSFEAVSNRTYTVQHTETVDGANWQKLSDIVARPTNRREPFTNSINGTNRFFRIVTPRQP